MRIPIIRIVAAACAAFLSVLALQAQSRPTGSITGHVNNVSTSAMLQDAIVEVPVLGLRTQTDREGRYVLSNVPAGEHQLVVSYMGLDKLTQSVTVTEGQRSVSDFELNSDVYRLPEFKVTGEREGNAASLTRQRNAENVKNVVALDAFGNLPNDSAGEVLIRLPGIAGRFDDEGNVTGVAIRGAPAAMNTFSVDGNPQSSTGGFGNDFRTHAISGALFEEIEVTKSPTPEMPADSLGGNVNMKSRSSLAMKGRRIISYRAAARWAPDFYSQTPSRLNHQVHPMLSLRYQEVFDVLGGKRNLGLAVSTFYSENASGYHQTLQDYEYTTNSRAYVWDLRNTDAYNNRKQLSTNIKVDYKVSDTTQVWVSTILNNASEPFNNLYTSRAYTGRNAASIASDYTEDFTRVNPVAGSIVQLNSTMWSFISRERNLNAGAKHDLGSLQIDYDAYFNRSNSNLGNGGIGDKLGGGVFTMQVANVGWTVDKSGSGDFPVFTQTAGRDVYDPSSYGTGLLVTRNNARDTQNYGGKLNASYALSTAVPVTLKTGFSLRNKQVTEEGGDRRWNYVGTDSLGIFREMGLKTKDAQRTGLYLPFVDSKAVRRDIETNPTRWNDDVYYGETRKFIGTRGIEEEVAATYLQANTRIGRLSVVGGLRAERVTLDTRAYVASQTLSTTAQRNADPIAAARADYDNLLVEKGSYTDYFPGIHFTYRLTEGLQARLSVSNSYARPTLNNLFPTFTVNETLETVSLGNPSLKPYSSENWDLSLEYFFEPVGSVSVGVFRKNVSEYIYTGRGGIIGSGPNNGFNGDYAGYTINQPLNGGNATIQGIELAYQQQFTFLPGALKGFGFFANYTRQETEGDYGDKTGAPKSTDELADFIPETANVGLSYKYRALGASAMLNYTAAYLVAYDASAARLRYRDDRVVVNLGLTYALNPRYSLSVDVQNAFNAPQSFYRYMDSHTERITVNGTTLVFGVSGRF